MNRSSLPYEEQTHDLQGGARYISIVPARQRRSLPEAVATERIAEAAQTASRDPASKWLLNFDLSFIGGATARYPRRSGAPVDRICNVLAERSARDVALSIWSDSDDGDPTGPITAVAVRVFRAPGTHR